MRFSRIQFRNACISTTVREEENLIPVKSMQLAKAHPEIRLTKGLITTSPEQAAASMIIFLTVTGSVPLTARCCSSQGVLSNARGPIYSTESGIETASSRA